MHIVEGDVDSGGVNVHYYRAGVAGKEPLLLAHGFTDNGLCWQRVVEALEPDFDLVMVDSRNHGKSGDGPASLDLLAQDMAAVVTQLQLRQVAVLGHSMGANVAACFAGAYPELVTRLLLEDPAWFAKLGDPAHAPARNKAFRDYAAKLSEQSNAEILAAGKQQHPLWDDAEFVHWVTANTQVRASAMEQVDFGDWKLLVPKIVCPTLLIYAAGDRDGIVSHETAERVQALNPGIALHHIADGGHNLRREQFAGFVAAVRGFLES